VSEQKQNTYIMHTFLIAAVIVVALVLFLRHQWGGH
jgi:predicted nucleic acid-binding Zn ribbon protein